MGSYRQIAHRSGIERIIHDYRERLGHYLSTLSELLRGAVKAIIDYNGNKITELDNDEIKFKPDCIDTKIIAVKKGQSWGIIDLKGNVLIPFEYDDIVSIDSHNAVVGKNGKYGLIDPCG